MINTIHILILFLYFIVTTVFAQDENPYHYNKVYGYENDTIVTKPFHIDSLSTLAHKLIGAAYKSPGRSPSGFDCSGFAFYCFREHSIYLPYSSHEQAKIGKPISTSEGEAGDLIFFQGYDLNDKSVHHVGILVIKKAIN